MSAKVINLVVEQGTDFQSTFSILNDNNNSPLNLYGYTAVSSIKKSYYSSTSYPFEISFPNRERGQIRVSMAKTETKNLEGGRYVYDVLITSPNNFTTRVVQGSVLVTPGVTI
jgi:hypothetical protein